MAAPKFAMDVESTQSNLSSADQAGTAPANAAVGGVRPGGYMMALTGAIHGVRATKQAGATTRSTTNTATRQLSIVTVQNAEASNAAVLTT
ncbi:hypothetical protein [Mycobacterium sp.]|uniref:hypothetical protein n=1 Tax=Mycobacterium sp. TaxID=1785 RepID=UPI0031D87529